MTVFIRTSEGIINVSLAVKITFNETEEGCTAVLYYSDKDMICLNGKDSEKLKKFFDERVSIV